MLYAVHWKVDVRPVLAVVGVAVHVDFVSLVIRARRVVHEHYITVLQVLSHVFLVKTERRVSARVNLLACAVGARPLKLRWRFAEEHGKHVVNRTEHFRLAFLYVGFLGFVSHGLT